MTTKAGPIISSDSHLEGPPERWVRRVPAKYRDRAPRLIRRPEGDAMVIEGTGLVENPQDMYAGRTPANWRPFDLKYENQPGTGSGEQRLKEQEQDGIEAEVLFASQVHGPSLWRNISDDDAYLAVVRAYNDWLAEEYCSVAPDRLIGLGVIPWTNADDAVAEMEHCAKLGLRGVVLGVFPNGKGYPTPGDDRFWAAAVDMRMPLTVHVAFNRAGARASQPKLKYPVEDPDIMRKAAGRTLIDRVSRFGLEPALSLSQLALSGVFDRFPELRIFFAETRLGWVPFWMENGDMAYGRNQPWSERYMGFKPLQRLPSEYVKDHILFSIQYERTGIEVRHLIGVDQVMFATDFPHIECEWPNTASIVEELYADVPDVERRKILAENVIRFFHMEETPLARRVAARAQAVG